MSLWKSFIIEQFHNSPQAHMQKTQSRNKETSFCICHKASLTMEATIVIPVAASFLIMILFFFRIIQVQAVVEEALIYAGRKTAVESSILDSELVQFASAEAFLLYALKDEPVITSYVDNGSVGVVLLGSEFEGNRIVLQANYRVKFPITIFGIDGIALWNRNVFRKWVGDMPVSDTEGEVWVYVTPNGEVYHATASCRALKRNIHQEYLKIVQDLRGANGQKYYACSYCAKESTEIDIVYYTDYGALYHGKIDCKHIKRTVNKQALSEVKDRRPCSYCY